MLAQAWRQMERTSPWSRDAAEQGLNEEIPALKSPLASFSEEATKLEEQLREKDVEDRRLRGELEGTATRNDNLQARLIDAKAGAAAAALQAEAGADASKKENERLSQQVQAATVLRDENMRQLEEIAAENERLVAELNAAEASAQARLQEVESKQQRAAAALADDRAAAATEKEALEGQLRRAQSHGVELESRLHTLQGDLDRAQVAVATLCVEKREGDQKLTALSDQLRTLTDHVGVSRATAADLEARLRDREVYCAQLIEEKFILQEIRRDLHNRVMQLSGNIRVYVRVRPLLKNEHPGEQELSSGGHGRRSSSSSGGSGGPPKDGGRPSSRGSLMPARSMSVPRASSTQVHPGNGPMAECPFHFSSLADRAAVTSLPDQSSPPNYASFHDLTKQTLELTEPQKDRGGLSKRRKKWKFGFDRVFHPGDGQEDVWAGAEPLVQSAVDGFHVCMFGEAFVAVFV